MLEPIIDSNYPDEVTWSLPDKAQGVLMNAYGNIPNRFDFYSGTNFLDAATDNAVTNNYSSGIFRVGSAGAISSLDNPVGDWSNAYTQFRNIHLFLENGLTPKVVYDLTSASNDSLYKRRLRGEAYFLRAWWGFQLLQQYGGKTGTGAALGYPIQLRTLTEEEAKRVDITRNSYEECAMQIMNDCDSAFVYLPSEYSGSDNITGATNIGRADKKVAITLKARVAVYAASPAYQPDDIVKLNTMGSFTITDDIKYQDKWIRAESVAVSAIAVTGNFSSLKLADFSNATTPAEFIWRRFHNARFMEEAHYSPYEFGNGITGPSQNLVDAFPALNGYPITDARSNYNSQNPYANRDPRLALNIYYNNAIIDGRPLETFDGGLDSRKFFYNATRTGYYVKKWLSVKPDMLNPTNPVNDFHYYVMLRKTELFLNLAEALNEAYGPTVKPAGRTFSASDIIKNIRKGAGLTATSSDAYVNEVAAKGKDDFRKLIQNERRLELAFENHRYFDMRRWLLPLDEVVKGINIIKDGSAFIYNVIDVEPRPLNNVKYYYMPLPYYEVSRSKTLVNNLGW